MKTELYCIRHEQIVWAELKPIMGHIEIVEVTEYPFHDADFCEFEDGWATVPPPEFDLQEYVDQMGQTPAVLEDFLPYDYNVETDQIVELVLI